MACGPQIGHRGGIEEDDLFYTASFQNYLAVPTKECSFKCSILDYHMRKPTKGFMLHTADFDMMQ